MGFAGITTGSHIPAGPLLKRRHKQSRQGSDRERRKGGGRENERIDEFDDRAAALAFSVGNWVEVQRGSNVEGEVGEITRMGTQWWKSGQAKVDLSGVGEKWIALDKFKNSRHVFRNARLPTRCHI